MLQPALNLRPTSLSVKTLLSLST